MSVAVYALRGGPSRRVLLQDSINLAEALAASSGQAIPVFDSLEEPTFLYELILAAESTLDVGPRLRNHLIGMRDNGIRIVGVVLFERGVDEDDAIDQVEKEMLELLTWGSLGVDAPFYTVDPDQMGRETKAGVAGRLPAALVTHVKGRVAEDKDLKDQSRHGASPLVQAAGGQEGFRLLVDSAMKNRFNGASGSLPRFNREVRVVTQALRRVWSGEAAVAWLRSPNTYLEGARPMDVFSLHGPDQVMDALNEASAGRYA